MPSYRLFTTIAAAAMSLAVGSAPALAADIQVISGPIGIVPGSRAVQIAAYAPVGQSFTAIDSTLTSFGFQFTTINNVAGAPVTFSLLSGAGLGGAVLTSQTLALPTTFSTDPAAFYNFDIAPTAVTIGQAYTAILSTTSTRYGISLGPNYSYALGSTVGGDAYAGGRAYFGKASGYANCDAAVSDCDLNFRVSGFTNAAAAVPEPATWALMIVGIGAVGGTLRRRRPAALASA